MDFTKIDKNKITKILHTHYPILIGSTPGSGKTHSLINLTDEEKSKTIVINADGKAIGDIHKYNAVIVFDSTSSMQPSDNIITIDSNNRNAFDNLINLLNKIKQGQNAQRLVIDTLTSLLNWLENFVIKHMGKSFDTWSSYNRYISELINTLLTFSFFNKAVYVFGHYRPLNDLNDTMYIAVNGNKHKNLIESYFSTVVFMKKSTNPTRFYYYADTGNNDDTTRTSVKGARFSFQRYSLTTLEDFLFAETIEEKKKVIEEAKRKIEQDLDNESAEIIFEEF